jgi:aspartate dehydrogenase
MTLRVGLIGQGAIAQYVAHGLPAIGARLELVLIRQGRGDAARIAFGAEVALSEGIEGYSPDIMVDCAGHQGLAQHGAAILRAGIPLVTVSLGALADPQLEAELRQAACDGDTRLILCSGALGGLDALRAARMGRLDSVTYTGRKPPAGWAGSRAEEVLDLSEPLCGPVTHFEGSARQAALLYPKNANVAAAVALAGAGFDQTCVRLIADPAADGNIHEVEAVGDFGTMRFAITGRTLPDNPRTSALAAMSVLSALADYSSPLSF